MLYNENLHEEERHLIQQIAEQTERGKIEWELTEYNPCLLYTSMWLTGFDVPALDTIYIDKPIQQHSLIQTISRVNRV